MPSMEAADNKRLLHQVFDELAIGNGRPFGELMSEDFSWTIKGHGPWGGTWRGRDTVRKEMNALFAQFATPYCSTAEAIIAEDDRVVVLCRGRTTTRDGKPYDNSYCYVIRMRAGLMVELIEYLDTQLMAELLAPPATART